MHFLNAFTDTVDAVGSIGSFIVATVAWFIAWKSRKQGMKIERLEEIVVELQKQTQLLSNDVAINQTRLQLHELEAQYETGPFFESGNSRPIDIGVILVEIVNMGRTANKVTAISDSPIVTHIRAQTHPIRSRMQVQIFVTVDQKDRRNHPFTFSIQYSGQGKQWYEQQVKNHGSGTITVSDRERIDRPAE